MIVLLPQRYRQNTNLARFLESAIFLPRKLGSLVHPQHGILFSALGSRSEIDYQTSVSLNKNVCLAWFIAQQCSVVDRELVVAYSSAQNIGRSATVDFSRSSKPRNRPEIPNGKARVLREVQGLVIPAFCKLFSSSPSPLFASSFRDLRSIFLFIDHSNVLTDGFECSFASNSQVEDRGMEEQPLRSNSDYHIKVMMIDFVFRWRSTPLRVGVNRRI